MISLYHLTVNGQPIADAMAVSLSVAIEAVNALRNARERGKRFEVEPCSARCWHPGQMVRVA